MTISLANIWAGRQASGYSEGWGVDQGGGAEKFKIAWSDKADARGVMLQSFHSDVTDLQCTAISFEAIGWKDGEAHPSHVLLNATYTDAGRAQWQVVHSDMNNWLEHWEAGGEALTVGKGYSWSDGTDTGKPILKGEVAGVQIFPHITITLSGKVNNLAAGKAKIAATIGKTNTAAITIKDYSWAAGELLFLGVGADEGVDSSSTSDIYAMQYRFGGKYGHTWNELLRDDDPAGARFVLVHKTGFPDTPLYESANFSDINPIKW